MEEARLAPEPGVGSVPRDQPCVVVALMGGPPPRRTKDCGFPLPPHPPSLPVYQRAPSSAPCGAEKLYCPNRLRGVRGLSNCLKQQSATHTNK